MTSDMLRTSESCLTDWTFVVTAHCWVRRAGEMKDTTAKGERWWKKSLFVFSYLHWITSYLLIGKLRHPVGHTLQERDMVTKFEGRWSRSAHNNRVVHYRNLLGILNFVLGARLTTFLQLNPFLALNMTHFVETCLSKIHSEIKHFSPHCINTARPVTSDLLLNSESKTGDG